MTKTLKLVLAFVLIAGIISQSAFAQATFSVKTDFAVASTQYCISFGDINGDGKQDMVTTKGTNVSVFLNTTTTGASTPTFSARTDFVTGGSSRYVVAGDINGDGKPDLVAASSTVVSVLLNTTATGAATPTFSAKTDFAVLGGIYTLELGDLNGDGKFDIAATNSNSISVFLNTTPTGNATPTMSARTDFATGNFPTGVTIADFNGDGKSDLASANQSSNSVSVLINTTPTGNTTPTFAAKVDFVTGASSSPNSISSGDLNGDGKPDLAVASLGISSISVFLNSTTTGSATPTFSAITDFSTGTNSFAAFVSIGDLNGDGKPDMATANFGTSNVSVFLNSTTPGSSTPSFFTRADFGGPANTNSVKMCDINGDGKPDLAVSSEGSNNISVLFNTTTVGATPAPSFGTKNDFATGSLPFGVAACDFNGDGKQDVVTCNLIANTASVFFNTTSPGASTPTFSLGTDFSTGSFPIFITVGDLNGDGKYDIVSANNGSSSVSVFFNTTTPGASTPSFSAKTDFATGTSPNWISLGDLNGDGKLDITVANNASGTISVLLNTTSPGAGTPSFSAKTDFTAGTNLIAVTLADINGDGKPDMAGANQSSNNVSVFINTTTPGASTPTFTLKTDFTTGTQPYSVNFGDMNGDGKPDMAVTNQGSNSVSVFFNTTTPGSTTPTFGAKVDFTTGVTTQTVALADKNGDGKKDILTANSGNFTLSVFINTTTPGASTPSFSAKTDYMTAGNAAYCMVSDLNNDGKPDIATANTGSDNFSVFLNTAEYPLPVELASFTSSVNSNNVTLNWSTVQEQNNKGFEIERNSFGTGWKKIGYIDGHGTINTQQNYTFKDNSLNTGRYSYRLKQIDYNGNFEYYELSNEVVIGVPSKYSLAQNYPNPFNPSTVLSFQLPVAGFVSLKIFDISGREVSSLVNEVKETGYYSVTFDAKSLSSGMYFSKIVSGTFSDTKKMILLK